MENHTVTKYDVFISYSRQDYVDEQKNVIPGNEVSKVKEALTSAGITYWFDEEGIYSGQNFVEKIVTNIENAKIFLFLSTANANKSPWTCKEIASADEFKKHIIPVRLDSSPYNKKVLFRIADLDYIEYFSNPQKGMEDMITSIKAYLDELAAEEKRKAEEESKKKEEARKRIEAEKKRLEQEERKRQEEQKRLITEIKLECTTLNNEEAKIELDRDSLLLKAEGVLDISDRDSLVDMIKAGGAIHQKCLGECAELSKEFEKLKSDYSKSLEERKSKDEQIAQLRSELKAAKTREEETRRRADGLENQINTLHKKLNDFQNNDGTNKKEGKTSKRVHISYWIVISILLIGGIVWLSNVYRESSYMEYYYERTLDELHETKDILNALSDRFPFLITDIEVKNDGDEWGNKIYSSKSTYFMPRIKYIGLREGTYDIKIKIYDNTGELSRNENKSPNGYTSSNEFKVDSGEHYEELTGWGNETPGNWPTGTYRIEIWCEGKKMSEKTFRVY